MSFVDRMQNAAGISLLLSQYSIEDPTRLENDQGGTEVRFKRSSMQHRKQVSNGVTGRGVDGEQWVDANVRHQRIRTAQKIAHLELRESRDHKAKKEAVAQATQHLIDAATGFYLPGASPDEATRLTRQAEWEFGATSTMGSKILVANFHAAPVPGRTIPCYHLPWNPTGCAMRLRIPNKGGGAVTDDNPVMFLTSALSGCSIYILGTPEEPIVYHCGTGGQTGGKNSRHFWDAVMKKIGQDVSASHVGAVHAPDYMQPKHGPSGVAETRRQVTERTLKKDAGRDFRIESTLSWGSVFGLRDPGGRWRFYLQQNVSVHYFEYRHTGPFGLGRKRIDLKQSVSRPTLLQEIFPAEGGGAARLVEPRLRLV